MVLISSPSEHGLYLVTKGRNGKEQKELIWEKCKIINTETGETLSSDIRPKFDYCTCFDDYYADFEAGMIRFLEPMFALDMDLDEADNRHYHIAEKKKDGHRSLTYLGKEHNRSFSRRISKKTGWYSENSDQIPHIRDLKIPAFAGTVLDGEIMWGRNSTECQSVMGALPQTAIQKQFETKQLAQYLCFDILYYKGINIQKMPLIKRKFYLNKVITAIQKQYAINYIDMLPIIALKKDFDHLVNMKVGRVQKVFSFRDHFTEVVRKGEEGLIIKDLNAPYRQGRRTKDMEKLKAAIQRDCIIMGLTEPTREYTGKKLEEDKMDQWSYWEHEDGSIIYNPTDEEKEQFELIPVTKPYAMGWCGGIICGVWKPLSSKELSALSLDETKKLRKENRLMNIKGTQHILTEVVTAKGLDEKTMQDLKENWEEYVADHRVILVGAQQILDKKKGSLRNPKFLDWRDDKNHTECTWNAHIGEEE